MQPHEHPAVRDFLDRFSAMLEGEGLPRGPARMLGLLFVIGGERTAEEMSEALGISRSNVSTSVRLLESYGLVERRRHAGERHDVFRLPPEPFVPMLAAGVARAARMRDMVGECRAALPPALDDASARLADLQQYFGFAAGWLGAMLTDWAAGRRSPEGGAS